MAKPDVSFLLKDVDRQRSFAQDALEQARLIESALGTAAPQDYELLVKLKERLLDLADKLTANATTTSVSSTELIGSLSKN